MKYVICGPWIGEYAYEMCWWSPKLRKLIKSKYNNYYKIHIGYAGRELFYRDFIDEYISYDKVTQNNIGDVCSGHVIINGVVKYSSPAAENFLDNWIYNNISNDDTVVRITPASLHTLVKTDTLEDFPDGEYIYLMPEPAINAEVKKFLSKFNNNRKTVCVMANDADIDGSGEEWKYNKWEDFINKIIDELKLNVVMIGVLPTTGQGGSLSFKNSKILKKHSDYIKSFVLQPGIKNSIDYQVSLLQNTSCSIYGSTTAAHLAFFANTPLFAQLVLSSKNRCNFGWQKKLTNNYKNIKFLCKYKAGDDIYNSPVDEMVHQFKSFFLSLMKTTASR